MRKKVQNDPGRDAKFLAQYKCLGEVVQTLAIDDEDEFVHPTCLQKRADLLTTKNPDQFVSPNPMVLDREGKLISRFAVANHGHMSHVERTVFMEFPQDDPICNKKDIVENERR